MFLKFPNGSYFWTLKRNSLKVCLISITEEKEKLMWFSVHCYNAIAGIKKKIIVFLFIKKSWTNRSLQLNCYITE